MSQALALPADTDVLDAASDPGAFVIASLERARSWLAQASTTDLPDLVEAKARAEAIRCYVAQKELGKDTELAATEIVRRAERRIGQLIREGQVNGEIKTVGTTGPQPDYVRNGKLVSSSRGAPPDANSTSPSAYFSSGSDTAATYAVTDGVSDEEFEDVIAEAKAEKNLSRANVVRKVKGKKDPTDALQRLNVEHRTEQIRELAPSGMTAVQIGVKIGLSPENVRRYAAAAAIQIPGDIATRKTKKLNHDRMMSETCHALEGAAMVAGMIDLARLDPTQIEGWVDSLSSSLSKLSTLKRDLAKESTQP